MDEARSEGPKTATGGPASTPPALTVHTPERKLEIRERIESRLGLSASSRTL